MDQHTSKDSALIPVVKKLMLHNKPDKKRQITFTTPRNLKSSQSSASILKSPNYAKITT